MAARRQREREDAGHRSFAERLSVTQKVTLLGTIVALLAGVSGLFDWAADKVTSDPPPDIESRIISADLEPARERFRDWLRDIGESEEGIPRFHLRQEGLLFALRVQLKGTEGREFPLRWIMYANTGRRLPRDTYTQSPFNIEPSNQRHAASFTVWTPYPPRPGKYYVRFTILTEKGMPAAEKITKPFTIAHIPALR